jgi:hypothetical protein
MADTKISALPAASSVNDAMEFEVNDAGTSKKVTGAQIRNNSGGAKIYVAYLTQTGTNAPVATVIKNTLGGTVVWARSSTGSYTGTLAGAFVAANLAIPSSPLFVPLSTTDFKLVYTSRFSDDVISVTSFSGPLSTIVIVDGMLTGFFIKIEVYN